MYKKSMSKLSVVLPSWGRYNLTLRMLNSISLQTLNEYELFFLGDSCEVFEKVLQSKDFQSMNFKGQVIAKNFDSHDGTSSQAINYSIENSTGEYFLFLSNDDIIFPKHFENYYNMTKESGKDFGIFKTYIDYGNGVLQKRNPELLPTKIGHSELCFKSDVIKKLPQHSRVYGHDWEFIVNALNNKCTYEFFNNDPTYIVNLEFNREHNWEGGRFL
jgi:glycosyltransferase involved in cell wall biosynthesis